MKKPPKSKLGSTEWMAWMRTQRGKRRVKARLAPRRPQERRIKLKSKTRRRTTMAKKTYRRKSKPSFKSQAIKVLMGVGAATLIGTGTAGALGGYFLGGPLGAIGGYLGGEGLGGLAGGLQTGGNGGGQRVYS